MSMRGFSRALLLVGFVGISGCGRDSNFIYHRYAEPTQTHRYDHPLKSVQGNNKVDILLVIDNSGSMGTHQANLQKNAQLFIDKFTQGSRLDWRMAMVTADPNDTAFMGMDPSNRVDRTRRDAVDVFKQSITDLNRRGRGEEACFAATLTALANHKDFVRPGSTLAVLMITDAAEQSNISGDDFLKRLQLGRGRGSMIVYGVLASRDFQCEPGSGEEPYSYATSPYKEAIEATKGRQYSLCDDFGPSLADLGNHLLTRTDRPFIQLATRPL